VAHCVAKGAAEDKIETENVLPFYLANATREILEGFFAKAVVLVEGPTESLALPIYLERTGLDTAKEGVAVIPVHGKGNLAKWYRLFTAYEIPCYVVFDNDGDTDDKKQVKRRDALLALNKLGYAVDAFIIDAGRFVDYVELDAASNRGVEEITQLLDQAVYKPVLGRFKVYLIDEVHMLSNTAFNAMLKTLEEPPEYLKFVLATTDPQKVPPTVLSRCLQFNLRPMAPQTVQEHLSTVLVAENIAAEPGALRLLARAARGSMRDALSLTDQAIAFGAGSLSEANVRQMLGAVDRGHAERLVEALAAGQGAAVIAVVDGLRALGLSASGTLEEMAALLQQMAVLQAVPDAVDDTDPDAPTAARLSALLAPDETQLFYSIVLHGRGELGLAPDEYSGLVMVLLRMLAFQPMDGTPAVVGGGQTVMPQSTVAPVSAAHSVSAPAPGQVTAATTASPWREPDWNSLVETLGLKGAAQQLAANCVYRRREGITVHLEINPAHQQMITPQSQGRLEEALSRQYGEPLKVRIQVGEGTLVTPAKLGELREADKLAAARSAIAADPIMRQLGETFGTPVNPDLVKPAD